MTRFGTANRYVYFARVLTNGGPIKIGCSQYTGQRLEGLASWCPYPIEIAAVVPGNLKLERNVHECFADLHLHHEWFLDDGRINAVIEKIRAGKPIEKAMDLSKRVGSITKRAMPKTYVPWSTKAYLRSVE